MKLSLNWNCDAETVSERGTRMMYSYKTSVNSTVTSHERHDIWNQSTVCSTACSAWQHRKGSSPSAIHMHWWTVSVLVQLIACPVPSHYQHQCCKIANWTFGNKLQWNLNSNIKLFIHENVFETVICKIAAILSRGSSAECTSISRCHHGFTIHQSSPAPNWAYELNGSKDQYTCILILGHYSWTNMSMA